MRKIVTLLLLSMLLAGCREDIPPVVAGSVVDGGLFLGEFVLHRKGRTPARWDLDRVQLEALNAWLQHHRDGWEMVVASPPPPGLSIVMTHPDGTHSRMDFFDMNDYWRHTVVVHAPSASDNGIRNLTVRETQELWAILQKKS